ncbi:MAG: Mur ligase family protein, partial [Gammaproteobacteria bacterium]|nr:Mur ligase family protein [Gammaproteobacteria bacterium]
ARGGLMRRGLPIPKADACLITNVAADHLGDYGITDVSALADAKFLLARAVKPGGRLVLNGDDPELVSRSVNFAGGITWYGLSLEQQALNCWINNDGHAVFVKDGMMTLAREREHIPILPVADFAPGLGGAAKFNVSNALGAIALASALGLPVSAMTNALSSFKGTPDENPGRGNFMEIGGIKILIDFAHNPHGVAALVEAVKDIPAKRRLFLLSQAGDRSDEVIREMTRVVWDARPDMIIVKELESKLRGRKIGEIPAIFLDELHSLGAPASAVMQADDDIDSVHQALQWAQPGDFLVLLIYSDRKQVLALLEDLKNNNWQAGEPIAR